jgi:hypothetical protein
MKRECGSCRWYFEDPDLTNRSGESVGHCRWPTPKVPVSLGWPTKYTSVGYYVSESNRRIMPADWGTDAPPPEGVSYLACEAWEQKPPRILFLTSKEVAARDRAEAVARRLRDRDRGREIVRRAVRSALRYLPWRWG